MVAYVSLEGKIMLMPGWLKSTVRSIAVTKADGSVESLSRESTQPGVGANLVGVGGEVDEGSEASVVPSPSASRLEHSASEVAPRAQVLQDPGSARRPGWRRLVVPSSCAPGVGKGPAVFSGPRRGGSSGPPLRRCRLCPLDVEERSLGVPGSSSGGGRRRKRRARGVGMCPEGLPRSVYEHHWKDVHGRGQHAALRGDFSYVLRTAAEAGCRKCVFDILNAHPERAQEMVLSEGTSGWDAAEYASWGKKQALIAGDIEHARTCEVLQDHLERMRIDGVFAFFASEYFSENLGFKSEDDDVGEDALPSGMDDK